MKKQEGKGFFENPETTKEERVKNIQYYKPSFDEIALLDKISKEVAKKFQAPKARWCNEEKSYVTIPYGEKSKIEVVGREGRTKSYIVDTKIADGVCQVSIGKMSFSLDVGKKFVHGCISKQLRDSSVTFEEIREKPACEDNKDIEYEMKCDRSNRCYIPKTSRPMQSAIELLVGFASYNQ